MRLVQILGDGIEELYAVQTATDKQLKQAWKNWESSEDYDIIDFENYCIDIESIQVERVFVDELYI